MKNRGTIVAIASPPGTGGVAMLRVSGEDAYAVTMKIVDRPQLKARHATYCHFVDKRDESQPEYIDDGLATYYPAPHSFTGEDVVELTCHGSQYVQERLIEALCRAGAQHAEPGEYTMRAFLNGKMNLSEAEAVADLIEATTPMQHQLAISQLRGGYATKLRELRQQMVDLTALLELELDFSQEDVEFADRSKLRALVDELSQDVEKLIDSFADGNAMKQGIPVALIGETNAGKSSLFNALVADDRAIVSAIPGTTRDTVEAMLAIGGATFRLIDTAGLRETDDEVERMGIERSHRAIEEASILIEVVDGTMFADKPEAVMQNSEDDGKEHIRVISKCDIDPSLYRYDDETKDNSRTICTSAKDDVGVDKIKNALADYAKKQRKSHDDVLLTNIRHRDALIQVRKALRFVAEGIEGGTSSELVVTDLREALYHLGTITGEITTDDVLGSVFSRFCIGK